MSNNTINPFPDESSVWVRYPMDHTTDRDWPWLPGTVLERCGPNTAWPRQGMDRDEWYVVVEVRELAILEDGGRPRKNTPEYRLLYPACFRDASELRRRDEGGAR